MSISTLMLLSSSLSATIGGFGWQKLQLYQRGDIILVDIYIYVKKGIFLPLSFLWN